jgi:hypothetical protein
MKSPTFTFAGGILSEGLWGRADLNKYMTGVKSADNMAIEVEGSLVKRLGLYYIGKRKIADKKSRMIPWEISQDDSYNLEFGHNFIRFIRFGGYVSIPVGDPGPHYDAANVGGVMEVASPWTAEQVQELKFTFANDIMYITHPDVAPQELRRYGLYGWDLVPTPFTPHPAFGGTLTLTQVNNLITADNYVPVNRDISYRVSATLADGTETLPSAIATINGDTGHPRLHINVSWPAVAGATRYTVYKGNGGVFGFVAYTTATSWQDRNIAPSFDVVPLDSAWSFGVAGQYPSVLEFYKQRMAYAATRLRPQSVWLSRPSLFSSLFKSIPTQDDDAILFTLVARKRQNIRHMVQMKSFIIFTDTGEWVLRGANGAPLTPSTAEPDFETSYGCHPILRPIPIGNRILFVKNVGSTILDLGYEYTADTFKADDLTRLTKDLFKHKEIVAYAYADYPYNMLFCVLSDGTMAVMTYVREHEIWGWTTMSTNGKILDVSAVSEGSLYSVYVQVEREIDGVKEYFIERLVNTQSDRIDELNYLDCSLTYTDDREYTNFTYLDETTVELDIAGHGLAVGAVLQYDFSEYDTVRLLVDSVSGDTLTCSIQRVSEVPEGIPASGTIYICAKILTNLNHLEGEPVSIVADGFVLPKLTPVLGELTLPEHYARVHIGIDYRAHVETLNLDHQSRIGGYLFKALDRITLNLTRSRGVYVGSANSEQDLEPIPSRDSSDNMYYPGSPLDGPYEVPAHVAWDREAFVRVESRSPLPLNIKNIVPDLVYGSD